MASDVRHGRRGEFVQSVLRVQPHLERGDVVGNVLDGGYFHEPHRPRLGRHGIVNQLDVLPTRIVVVAAQDDFLAGQSLRVGVEPLSSPSDVARRAETQQGQAVGVLLPLDDPYRLRFDNLWQPIQHPLDAIHAPNPLSTYGVALAERLRFQPYGLVNLNPQGVGVTVNLLDHRLFLWRHRKLLAVGVPVSWRTLPGEQVAQGKPHRSNNRVRRASGEAFQEDPAISPATDGEGCRAIVVRWALRHHAFGRLGGLVEPGYEILVGHIA